MNVQKGRCLDMFFGVHWLRKRDSQTANAADRVLQAAESARSHNGIIQSGAYVVVPPGQAMERVKAQLRRMELPETELARSPDWLLITQYETLAAALTSERRLREEVFASTDASAPQIVFSSLYRPFVYTTGLSDDPSGALAEVVQLGTFVVREPRDEWDLLDWYVQTKLPGFAEVIGGVRARPLVSVSGPTKFGVLYEFVSLETREEHFERVHEVRALDLESETGKVVSRILHAPMSPTVGRRLGEAPT